MEAEVGGGAGSKDVGVDQHHLLAQTGEFASELAGDGRGANLCAAAADGDDWSARRERRIGLRGDADELAELGSLVGH